MYSNSNFLIIERKLIYMYIYIYTYILIINKNIITSIIYTRLQEQK